MAADQFWNCVESDFFMCLHRLALFRRVDPLVLHFLMRNSGEDFGNCFANLKMGACCGIFPDKAAKPFWVTWTPRVWVIFGLRPGSQGEWVRLPNATNVFSSPAEVI